MEADDPRAPAADARPGRAAGGRRRRRSSASAALLGRAERPVIMAGTDLYWGHGENALRELSEALGIPVFLNGLARGCLPADHPNFFSRARSAALKGADVALVIGRADGLPARLRRQLRRATRRSSRSTPPTRPRRRRASSRASSTAGCPRRSSALREAALDAGGGPHRDRGVARRAARDRGREARRRAASSSNDDRAPLHPLRVYKELATCSTATRS